MILKVIVLVGILTRIGVSSNCESNRPVVVSCEGKVRGVHMKTVNERMIYGFLGIPYAKPPVGDLRFRAPVPVDPWTGTWDARSDRDQCPQFSPEGELVGNEDCLHINVYTPQLPKGKGDKFLPVLVFYHGGAWKTGSNNSSFYGPGYLLDRDMVLVVPNYRLNIFGFLSTGNKAALGNFGLKDQLLSLEWVHRNIQHFGGDPSKITISGQSSGGSSIELLLMTDKAAGLCHRYIATSTSAWSYYVQQPRIPYARRAIQFGKRIGCNTENSKDLVNCLRNRSVSELMTKESLLYAWNVYPLVLWGPTVEPQIEGALLTEMAIDVYESGRFPNLPCITGVNENDGFALTGVFYNNTNDFGYFLEHFDYLAPYVLFYYNQNVERAEITAAIKEYYFGNDFSQCLKILLRNMTNLVSDSVWNAPCQRVLDIKSKYGIGPSYFYTFHYRGDYSYSSVFPVPGTRGYYGAVHYDELLYLFPQNRALFATANERLSQNDNMMKDTMVELWAKFVTNGKPTIGEPNDIVGWKPYSSRYNHLQIGEGAVPNLIHRYSFLEERMRFWKNLYDTTFLP